VGTVYATVEDLEATWHPLSDADKAVATTLLNYASILIRQAFPDIDSRMDASEDLTDLVRFVCIEMVKRAMRNPDGYTYQTVGPFSFQRDTKGLASGALGLLDSEVELLSPPLSDTSNFGIGTIRTKSGYHHYEHRHHHWSERDASRW